MAKMFFSSQNCKGVTSGVTGKTYNADSKGFVNVEDRRDIKALKDGGYVMASGVGALSAVRQEWFCDECAWTAVINSCGKCGSKNLRKIER